MTRQERRVSGKCICGRPVVHVRNSVLPTVFTDGSRYIYPEEPDTGWSLFRCTSCSAVISDNFTADHWYTLQIERGHGDTAAQFIRELRFEPYIPVLRARRMLRGKLVEAEVPRFGPYIFARFNAGADRWGHLIHANGKRAGIMRVMCSTTGEGDVFPIPVPDSVVDKIRAYEPAAIKTNEPYRYQAGQACFVTVGGVRLQAVFMAYCGTRPMVRTWIFGRPSVVEVKAADIEPQNLDINEGLATISAA
jgi:hypothetical protein